MLLWRDGNRIHVRFKYLEATLLGVHNRAGRETRQLTEKLENELDLSDRIYRVDTTGAILTIENAKAHLYHFCSVSTLHASNYIDLRPQFDTAKDVTSKLWTAVVDLPSFVHISVRNASSSQGWKTEDMAIKDAAFEAYVALHKNGLINDNLLPLTKDYAPEAGQHSDQPSIVSVSDRILSWTALWEKHLRSEHDWHPVCINVSSAGETLVDMVMWTPSVPPTLSEFKLYWNLEVTYTVKFLPSALAPIGCNSEHVGILRASTKLLLRSVHAARMPTEASDFPVLFIPADVAVVDLSKWLQEAHGTQNAREFFANNGNLDNAGLVRFTSQIGRTFFADDYDGTSVSVRSFPKRKDFLHPIAADSSASAAYTATQLFPLSECTIEVLPAKFAVFAAFVPSIMHRVDTALLAAELSSTILRDVGISDTLLVLEAISSPASGEINDYNRLEYLGDTCLKHCTELQVMAQHPNWPESYLTVERDRMVRNTNLAKAALDLGLDKYVLTKAFTGSKWRPPYLSEMLASEPKQRQMSTKTLADVVEALIGASFVDGGLAKALLCVKTLLPTETWLLPQHCFDTLIGEIRPTEMINLTLLEQLVGHQFANPTLLVEAITHVSLPYNTTGLSLERLEFLGDSVLDMLVTPKLFVHSRNLRHDQLHGAHEALVNSLFLGHL
jgi:dsRNA-specific ribonuclease